THSLREGHGHVDRLTYCYLNTNWKWSDDRSIHHHPSVAFRETGDQRYAICIADSAATRPRSIRSKDARLRIAFMNDDRRTDHWFGSGASQEKTYVPNPLCSGKSHDTLYFRRAGCF